MKGFPRLICISGESGVSAITGKTSGCAPAILVRADPHAHRGSIVYKPMTMTLFMAVREVGGSRRVSTVNAHRVSSTLPLHRFQFVNSPVSGRSLRWNTVWLHEQRLLWRSRDGGGAL